MYISSVCFILIFTVFLSVLCVSRARPVINIEKEITITPKKIDLTQKNCGNTFWYTSLLAFFW